jgi:AdoMet-dependent heme synthase
MDRQTHACEPPLFVEWEVHHRHDSTAAFAGELSTPDALAVIDKLAESGSLILGLAGEPLRRSDWRELARHAVARGLAVNLTTDGWRMTEEIADDLAALQISSVTVTLDSHQREVHDGIYRMPGLYDRAVAAIRSLARRGVRVLMGFTPNRLNSGRGARLLALAAELGAAAVTVSEYVVDEPAPDALALTSGELAEELAEWAALRNLWRGRVGVVLQEFRAGVPVPARREPRQPGCGAGRLYAHLLADGSMTPCAYLPTSVGSLRTEPFADVWNRLTDLPSGPPSGFCADCRLQAGCAVGVARTAVAA